MEKETVSRNFIEQIIDKDIAEGKCDTVCTRFPPEPNGYLHIGHAKSILLNYGIAQQYGGKFNLRFDDTNPTKEKMEFVESIKADVAWLGADWEDRLFFASSYFDQMYEAAVLLIKKGKAFVCDLSAEEIRQYRGTLTEPDSLDYEGNAKNFKSNMYQVSMDNTFINQMLERYPCTHHWLMLKQQTLADTLEESMLARNHPGMADVDASLLWLCQQVAQKEAVILSGECSDEIFGGYPWFYRDELKDLPTFPWLRSTPQRIELLKDDIKQLGYEAYIQQQYEDSIRDIRYLDTDSEDDRRARRHTQLCLKWFMQTLVTRQVCEGDRANLTIRAPFANVALLEYVYNIPWQMKFYHGQEKGILRKAFANELPEEVCWRKKNPFPKTHNPQYADIVAKMLMERYKDSTSALHELLDDAHLKELIATKGASFQLPWYGQLMSGPQLLAYLYQIDCWIRDYNIKIEK